MFRAQNLIGNREKIVPNNHGCRSELSRNAAVDIIIADSCETKIVKPNFHSQNNPLDANKNTTPAVSDLNRFVSLVDDGEVTITDILLLLSLNSKTKCTESKKASRYEIWW
jgi:hypothetical protein